MDWMAKAAKQKPCKNANAALVVTDLQHASGHLTAQVAGTHGTRQRRHPWPRPQEPAISREDRLNFYNFVGVRFHFVCFITRQASSARREKIWILDTSACQCPFASLAFVSDKN